MVLSSRYSGLPFEKSGQPKPKLQDSKHNPKHLKVLYPQENTTEINSTQTEIVMKEINSNPNHGLGQV